MEAYHKTSISPTNLQFRYFDNSATTYTNQFPSGLPEPDIQILTSGRIRIHVHSSILASASPVLESIINGPRKHRSSDRMVSILGVPSYAVVSFVQFLYTSRCTEADMEKYGIHLLALSHVYLVPQLKQRCIKHLGQHQRMRMENVVDMLQLARLCDAPDLYLNLMKFVSDHFEDVEKSEGWKFLQDNDPRLELQILQFIDEVESRKKKSRRHREEQSLYIQLSEAMECLEHICTEGCTTVGPYDVKSTNKREPCGKYTTCQGLQLLIKHFATCKNRVHSGCLRCKRMWQLLRLHTSICDLTDSCKVPLCRQFKLRLQQEKRKDDATWKKLVKKVKCARVISSLSHPARMREKVTKDTKMGSHSITQSFTLESVSPIQCF